MKLFIVISVILHGVVFGMVYDPVVKVTECEVYEFVEPELIRIEPQEVKPVIDEDVVLLLARYNFAEAANQESDCWVANTYVAFNRLNSVKYGDNIEEVITNMSSAIRNNSNQWQLATGQKNMNAYEKRVFNKIKNTMRSILRQEIKNPVGLATHFENVEAFGLPWWAREMVVTAKIGCHTYFA